MESFVFLPMRSGRGPEIPNLARSVGGCGEQHRIRSFNRQHGVAVSFNDVSAQKRRSNFHLESRESERNLLGLVSREVDCLSLTLPLNSLMEPPGVGSETPAPNLENTSPSSRDIPRRYTGGDDGTSVSSLTTFQLMV